MDMLLPQITDHWAHWIGWTLVHSAWQLALISALYWLLKQFVSSTNEPHRAQRLYLLGCTSMLSIIAVPIATFCLLTQTTPPHIGVTELPSEITSSDQPKLVPADLAELARTEFSTAVHEPPITTKIASLSTTADSLSTTQRKTFTPLSWLVVAWTLGVLLISLRPILGMIHAKRLENSGRSALPKALCDRAKQVADQLRISRGVRLLESALVEVPTVVGYLKPAILIPASALTGLSQKQLSLIIAHELAHIQRHDFLVNFSQTIIETLLFYHPATWWISNEVRIQRENCCDDIAVSLCEDPKAFAHALMALEQTRTAIPPALAANGGTLIARVCRLLDQPAPQPARARSIASVSVPALTIAIAAFALSVGLLPASSPGKSTTRLANASSPDTWRPTAENEREGVQPLQETFRPQLEKNDIVAQVNGISIHQAQVATALLERFGQETLENMINRQLLDDYCQTNGIEIADSDLENQLAKQAEKLGLTVESYVDKIRTKLAQTESEFREHVQFETALQRAIEYSTSASISPTDQAAFRDAKRNFLSQLVQQASIEFILGNPTKMQQHPGLAAIVNERQFSLESVRKRCQQRHGKNTINQLIRTEVIRQALERETIAIQRIDLSEQHDRTVKKTDFQTDQPPIKPNGWPNQERWTHTILDGEPTLQGETTYIPATVIKGNQSYVDQLWTAAALRKLVQNDGELTVTEDEITRAWESNYGPRAKVLAIVSNKNMAMKCWRLATANPTADYFGQLASKYSTEPTSRNNHGQVPPIAKHRGRQALKDAAFRLKEGQISEVIQVEDNWVILFGLGQTQPKPGTRKADVIDEVINDVLDKKMEVALFLKLQELLGASNIQRLGESKQQDTPGKQPPDREDRQIVKTYFVGDLLTPHPFVDTAKAESKTDKSEQQLDPEPLTELIQSTIGPDEWKNNGAIQFYPAALSLIVSTNQSTHDELQNLLQKLRELNEVTLAIRSFVVITPIQEKGGGVPLVQLPKNAGEISRRDAISLHSIALGNKENSCYDFPVHTIFNGQTAEFEIPILPDAKSPKVSLQQVITPDRQQARTVAIAVAGKVSKTFPVQTAASGTCIAINISNWLPENQRKEFRATFVYCTRIFDDREK